MSKNIVLEKSIKFALRIVKLYRYLSEEKSEYVLSKQILISGTHIAKIYQRRESGGNEICFCERYEYGFETSIGNRILVDDFARRRVY